LQVSQQDLPNKKSIMHFLEYYYFNTIKYDLINRFNYKNIKNVPKLNKIILNFGCKTFELKKLSTSLLSLQLITTKKGTLTVSKQPNIVLKIRKGNPVGCKVVLVKTVMYKFLSKLLIEVLPRLKNKILLKKVFYKNTLTYNFENIFIFKELEKNYLFFSILKNLQVTFVTNTLSNQELFFLLSSFKFPANTVKRGFANVTQLVECNLAKIKVKGSNPFFC
jgi:large subunit ribosomal protein L5